MPVLHRHGLAEPPDVYGCSDSDTFLFMNCNFFFSHVSMNSNFFSSVALDRGRR